MAPHGAPWGPMGSTRAPPQKFFFFFWRPAGRLYTKGGGSRGGESPEHPPKNPPTFLVGPWGGHGAPWGPMGGPGGLMAAVSLNDGAANKLPWGPGGPKSDLCHPPGAPKKPTFFFVFFSWALEGPENLEVEKLRFSEKIHCFGTNWHFPRPGNNLKQSLYTSFSRRRRLWPPLGSFHGLFGDFMKIA